MGEELCRSNVNNFGGMPGGVRGKGEDVEQAVFLDTNVNDGIWIWYRLGLIVYPIWLLMLRMDTFLVSFFVLSNLDMNVKNGTNIDIDWS